jgi:hypothetical protein
MKSIVGNSGTPTHLTNDKKYGVVIPLGDSKTESPEPEFTDPNSVTFLN